MKNRNDKSRSSIARMLVGRGTRIMEYNKSQNKLIMDYLSKSIQPFSPETMQRIAFAVEQSRYFNNLESVGLR
jgi:hypothetical protein